MTYQVVIRGGNIKYPVSRTVDVKKSQLEGEIARLISKFKGETAEVFKV